MAETDNPDDIILNPNRKQKHNTATSTFHEKEDVFEKKKDPVTKFFDWWDKLKFKPFVDISTGPEAPDGHSVTVGIKGTF